MTSCPQAPTLTPLLPTPQCQVELLMPPAPPVPPSPARGGEIQLPGHSQDTDETDGTMVGSGQASKVPLSLSCKLLDSRRPGSSDMEERLSQEREDNMNKPTKEAGEETFRGNFTEKPRHEPALHQHVSATARAHDGVGGMRGTQQGGHKWGGTTEGMTGGHDGGQVTSDRQGRDGVV